MLVMAIRVPAKLGARSLWLDKMPVGGFGAGHFTLIQRVVSSRNIAAQK